MKTFCKIDIILQQVIKKLLINAAALLLFYAVQIFPQTSYADQIFDDEQAAVMNVTMDSAGLSWMYNNVKSDSFHHASVHFKNRFIDTTFADAGFRIRGNTSRESQKKSFKISFNEFSLDQTLFGLNNLNLNGEHNDPSIIRSKICWDLYAAINNAASRAAHAELYINGVYYGLYINVEDYGRAFLKRSFHDPEGNLWKCLWPADLAWRGPDPNSYKFVTEGRRTYELQTNEDEDDYYQLARFIRIINQTPAQQLRDSLEYFMNIKELIKYFAVNNLTGSWDDYWFLKNNFFLYYEPSADKIHWIPYDYDNTFGIDWFGKDWATINPYTFAKIDNTPRPLVDKLFSVPEFKNLFTHFLKFYNTEVFALSKLEPRIDSLLSKITASALNDSFRSKDYGFTDDDFFNSYSVTGYINRHVKRGLKEFIQLKNNSLPSKLSYVDSPPIVYDISVSSYNPAAGDSTKVAASVFSKDDAASVTIEYTPGVLPVTYSYTMNYSPITGSSRVEDADRWVGIIPPLGDNAEGYFLIKVVDSKNQTVFYPKGRFVKIKSQSSAEGMKINELLARNVNSNTDPHGEYDDWIELYNPTSASIILDGKYLSDKKNNLTKWKFPSGSGSIQPNAYAVIWCDEDSGQTGFHTNFKLDAAGEFAALVDEDGVTVIDSISFGVQQTDVSLCRTPDGSETWFYTATPTPGTQNIVTSIKDEIIPNEFSLKVYPNPFNGIANVRIKIPFKENSKNILLRLFNILGEEVVAILNKELTSGEHNIRLNTDEFGLSSGVYFLQLASERMFITHKLLLLK